ncbi:hypothetical protein OBBRIDRAFT_800947 [Obba rivulosa]|uniref:DNA 3'-5' helicase n=1 Tax=Obba rivulosa TaxID=1052685 RepID=A0A8E2J5D3_9APHY|nr:hypothetical protein OBBRIDRAFT_800947 [Obba rivulosa]
MQNYQATTPPKQPLLSEDDLKSLSELMRSTYKRDSDPLPFQLAGVRCQLKGKDAIIQALMGAGKTAIAAGPHLWPGNENKVMVMVSPLMALEDEMVETFKNNFGLNAIAIYSKNGLCSPVVVKGADFHKKYSSLGIVRAFLCQGMPVIAVTATLMPWVRRDIHHKLQFARGESVFQNAGNDRPNVSIVVHAAEHAINSFTNLNFVIPATVQFALDIPKTYIYVDNITIGTDIVDYLNARIKLSIPAGVIHLFNATLSHEYWHEAIEKFRIGEICIMTGLAILIVERSAYSLVLLKPTQPQASALSKSTKQKQDKKTKKTLEEGKASKEYAQAHGLEYGASSYKDNVPNGEQPTLDPEAVDKELLTFVQSTTCRHHLWADIYDNNIKCIITYCTMLRHL